MRIAIVDYGMGNLSSVRNALKFVGADVQVVERPKDMEDAAAVVLPGVGAFARGMEGLRERGFVDELRKFVGTGRPFLGICLGLQLLAEKGFELGVTNGLGWVEGEVVRLDLPSEHRIPHIGWNDVVGSGPLFQGLPAKASFYFVHSFHLVPRDPKIVVGRTEYGGLEFASAIQRDNIHAVQFHPEKSHKHGLALLNNFVDIVRNA